MVVIPQQEPSAAAISIVHSLDGFFQLVFVDSFVSVAAFDKWEKSFWNFKVKEQDTPWQAKVDDKGRDAPQFAIHQGGDPAVSLYKKR